VILVTAMFLYSALCEDESEVIQLGEISSTKLASQII